MKKKFTFLLAALVLLGGLVGPMGKAKGQSITFTNLTNPQPTLSFSYGVGNEAPEGQYAYVSCANLGEGNDVTVSLNGGASSHFELWDCNPAKVHGPTLPNSQPPTLISIGLDSISSFA